MKIAVPYLNTTFPLEFPDENLLALAEPNEFSPAEDMETAFRKALAQPPGLAEFLAGGPRS